MNSFDQFLQWERATTDTIDFKKMYVDITGDILAGLMLSEIVYWHLPSKSGQSRMRVFRDGEMWIAVTRHEWWDRTRLTPREADRILKALCDANIVIKQVFKFDGTPMTHIRINEPVFLRLLNAVIADPPVNPFSPNGEMNVTPTVISTLQNPQHPYTETTTETTVKDSMPLAADIDGEIGKSEPAVPIRKPRARDPIYDAIGSVWETEASGFIVNVKRVLTGNNKKRDAWGQSALDIPADAAEIERFGLWAHQRMEDKFINEMPTSPATIQRWFMEFRKQGGKPKDTFSSFKFAN